MAGAQLKQRAHPNAGGRAIDCSQHVYRRRVAEAGVRPTLGSWSFNEGQGSISHSVEDVQKR